MIPGKPLTPELIVQMVWRRKWLIAVPAVIIAVGVATWTGTLVDFYRSDSVILVVPQRVPENFVRSTVTARIEDRLQAIQQQIMSRTRLERIVLDLDIYAEDRKTAIMEDIVERMRDDVEIAPIRGDAFRVGFVSDDPRMAMRVTERLASLFIDESLRDRAILAEGTNQFLEAQLEEARRMLVDNEKRLEEYRRQFDGQLPDQLAANQQGLQNTALQIQAIVDSLSRDRDWRLVLERALADASSGMLEMSAQGSGVLLTAAQQLAATQEQLAELRLRVTEEHPDVVALKRTIEELQARADAEAASQPVSGDLANLSPAEARRRGAVETLTRQLEELDKQLIAKTEQEARLRENLQVYQRRLEATPTRVSEMADLMRDYGTFQANYQSLLAKKQEAQLSANLERRQIGEQFRILDPARLPARPYFPNRARLYLLGILGGLAVGLGLAGALEYLDRTMRSEEDVRLALDFPVLATIPLSSGAVALRRRHHRVVAAAVSVMILLITVAAAAWSLLR